jgi:hypothetical protein
VIATEQAKWLNSREEKARRFDEIMRFGSPDQVMQYLEQVRGGQVEVRPGTQVTSNGNTAPPKGAGQYERENVLSYFPRS